MSSLQSQQRTGRFTSLQGKARFCNNICRVRTEHNLHETCGEERSFNRLALTIAAFVRLNFWPSQILHQVHGMRGRVGRSLMAGSAWKTLLGGGGENEGESRPGFQKGSAGALQVGAIFFFPAQNLNLVVYRPAAHLGIPTLAT